MRRRAPLGPILALALFACGESAGSPEPTTTHVTLPAVNDSPGTTAYADNPCFKFPVAVLNLQNDFRDESRGIVAPDRERYRARAQALVDEAKRLGCPEPVGLSSFLRG